MATPEDAEIVTILYTNYRGETGLRRIRPKRLWFGPTDWHPEHQWILDAEDVDRKKDRSFALKDVRAWIGSGNVSQ